MTTTLSSSPITIADDDPTGDRHHPIPVDSFPRRLRRRGGDPHHPITIIDDEIIDVAHPPRFVIDLEDPKGKKPLYSFDLNSPSFASPSSLPAHLATCTICYDDKFVYQMLAIKNCSHRYCFDCVAQYVRSKVDENVGTVTCPDPECGDGVLEMEMCRGILPKEVYERWGVVLCEMVIGAMRFYCPYKDCSAMLIDDGGEDGVPIVDTECPHCFRMFCARCKVPWHQDFTCEEFQGLGPEVRGDDLMVMRMAKKQKWQRCPRCCFYVEKIEGCLFVKCRCGTQFCYTCGTKTVRDHMCAKCMPNFPVAHQPFQLPQHPQFLQQHQVLLPQRYPANQHPLALPLYAGQPRQQIQLVQQHQLQQHQLLQQRQQQQLQQLQQRQLQQRQQQILGQLEQIVQQPQPLPQGEQQAAQDTRLQLLQVRLQARVRQQPEQQPQFGQQP